MKRLTLAPLIILKVLPDIALSQPLQIPVFPYKAEPQQVLYKVHARCKRFKNYSKCIKRFEQKVTTSIDMDD